MVHAEGPVRPVAGPTAITEPQASASGSNSTPAAALESSPDATHTTCTTNTSNPVTPSAASTPSGRSCGDEGGVGAVQGKLPWQSNVLGAYLVPQQGAGGSGVHHSQAAEEVESLPPYVCGNDASVQMRINEQLTKQYPCGLVICDALEPGMPLIYANHYFEYATGYESHEILGRNCRFLQCRGPYTSQRHELVDELVCRKVHEAINNAQEFSGDLVNFKKDGTALRTRLTMYPLYGDRQNRNLVTHWAGIQKFYVMREALLPRLNHDLEALPTQSSEVFKVGGALCPTPAAWTNASEDRAYILELGTNLQAKLLGMLDMQSLFLLAATCNEMNRVCNLESVWNLLCLRAWGPRMHSSLQLQANSLGWKRIVRELHTLEAVAWHPLKVGGSVYPARINFNTCSVGRKLILFGGEAAHAVALNDTFVLDLDVPNPSWEQWKLTPPEGCLYPPGRWGHTLRPLMDGKLVLFGGCGAAGALNDVWLLDHNNSSPHWKEVTCVGPIPPARSWHGACTLKNSQMLIFGGCDFSGRVLSETWRLHLESLPPRWEEIQVAWRPPARLGLSLCVTQAETVVMFGGLASVGPVRMRTNDLFQLKLSDPSPTWEYVCGTTLQAAPARLGPPLADTVPPPRMEQVMGSVPGERMIVFGGSLNDASKGSALQPWVVDVNTKCPRWRPLTAGGAAPEHTLGYTWGYSATMMDDLRFALLGRFRNGSLVFDELYELSLLSKVDPRRDPVHKAIPQLLSGTSTKSKEIGLVPPSYDPRRNERGSAGTTSSDEFNSSDEYTTMGTLVANKHRHSPGSSSDSMRSTGGSSKPKVVKEQPPLPNFPAGLSLRGPVEGRNWTENWSLKRPLTCLQSIVSLGGRSASLHADTRRRQNLVSNAGGWWNWRRGSRLNPSTSNVGASLDTELASGEGSNEAAQAGEGCEERNERAAPAPAQAAEQSPRQHPQSPIQDIAACQAAASLADEVARRMKQGVGRRRRRHDLQGSGVEPELPPARGEPQLSNHSSSARQWEQAQVVGRMCAEHALLPNVPQGLWEHRDSSEAGPGPRSAGNLNAAQRGPGEAACMKETSVGILGAQPQACVCEQHTARPARHGRGSSSNRDLGPAGCEHFGELLVDESGSGEGGGSGGGSGATDAGTAHDSQDTTPSTSDTGEETFNLSVSMHESVGSQGSSMVSMQTGSGAVSSNGDGLRDMSERAFRRDSYEGSSGCSSDVDPMEQHNNASGRASLGCSETDDPSEPMLLGSHRGSESVSESDDGEYK